MDISGSNAFDFFYHGLQSVAPSRAEMLDELSLAEEIIDIKINNGLW